MAERIAPILRVADAGVAATWYARLGFELVGEHRFAPELPCYAFVRRGDIELHLSEHRGDAPGPAVVYLYVDDVDAVVAGFGVEVRDQPWGRDVELTDPDGNRIRVGTVPRPD